MSFRQGEAEPPVGPAPPEGPGIAPAPAVPPAAPMLPVTGPPHRYTARFTVIYVALGLILAGAIVGVVVIALQPGPRQPAAWSSWRPTSSNVAKATQQIVDHVAPEYRMDAAGAPLVEVLPGTPELTRYSKVSTVSTIAIRSTASSQNFRLVSGTTAYQDQFCGLGSYCSIKGGTPSISRDRLIRREALEIALYTFKYLPQINSLIAYMPPPPGRLPSTLLFLERSAFPTQLSEPLTKTLPLATPPLPGAPDPTEAARIDRLTLPMQYSFQYQALSKNTVALVLTSA